LSHLPLAELQQLWELPRGRRRRARGSPPVVQDRAQPLPDIRPYRLALVRRTAAAPDSWSEYGVPVLADFDARPTFNYATPHNILRWTERTKVGEGESCYVNCHIIQEGDTYRNRHLYLFRSDMLLDWEISSNQGIFVDGQLPDAWGTP
jgi:hypothetical protein